MNRIRTTWVIVADAAKLMRKQKLLLLFPLLHVASMAGVVACFLSPILIGASLIEPDRGLVDGLTSGAMTDLDWRSIRLLLLLLLAVFYLVSIFVATFINVAFYSEILNALNGYDVSVARGLRVAIARIRAILSWSLLAGTVGLIIRMAQERLGSIGKWLTGFVGLSWSVASVFVLPAIVREDRQKSPMRYLQISAGLIKRTWGEGIIGFTGIAAVGLIVSICTMLIVVRVVFWLNTLTAAIVGVLVIAAIIYLFVVAMQVFRCSLYVYATEGVAPGEFDDEFFDRTWKVKQR